MAHVVAVKRGGQSEPLKIVFIGIDRRGHVKGENKGQPAGGLRLRRGRPQKAGGQESDGPYQCPVFSMLAHGSAGSSASPS